VIVQDSLLRGFGFLSCGFCAASAVGGGPGGDSSVLFRM
jgi:hypothetical protein